MRCHGNQKGHADKIHLINFKKESLLNYSLFGAFVTILLAF